MKRQLARASAREVLKRALCTGGGPLFIGEGDLAPLLEGEAVFLWESPVASPDAAADLARQAAAEMQPAPGRWLRAAVLHISGADLDTVQAIGEAFQAFSEPELLLGVDEAGQPGVRFLLATAEDQAV